MDRNAAVESVVSGKTWAEFCDLLRSAGDFILGEGAPEDPLDRAEGFRLLTRLTRGALETYVEHNDPTTPRLVCTCHETIKVIAENPDNLYLGASISGQYDYRVRGTRGSARWMSFNTHVGGFGTGGRGTSEALYADDLEIAPDGTFELVLSQREHPGNWMRLDPGATSFVVRQTFLDRKNETAGELSIERIGASGPPAPLDPVALHRGLLTVGHYVRAILEMTVDWSNASARHKNRFAEVQDERTRSYKDPRITYHQAYFELAPDEALVVEATPPKECEYWMFVLHNHWLESLDYRYHQITLNNHSARLEKDGSVRLIVAHRDPGLPNWLDTAGHARGTLGVRWVGKDVRDVIPRTRVVKLADLR